MGWPAQDSCCELQTKATSVLESRCCLRALNCFAHCSPSEDQLLWCTPRIALKDFILPLLTGLSMVYYLAQRAAIYHRLSYYTDTVPVLWVNLQVIVFFFLNTCPLFSCVFDLFQRGEERRAKLTWQDLIAASVLFYNVRAKYNSFCITVQTWNICQEVFINKSRLRGWANIKYAVIYRRSKLREELNYAELTQPTPPPPPQLLLPDTHIHTSIHCTMSFTNSTDI